MTTYFGNLKSNESFRFKGQLCIKLDEKNAMTDKGKKIVLDKKSEVFISD